MTYPSIEELLPRPDSDDPEWQGVEGWSVPGSDAVVMTWETAEGQRCWAAAESISGSDRGDNGYADDRDSALLSGTMCAMGLVARRITEAYTKRLIKSGGRR